MKTLYPILLVLCLSCYSPPAARAQGTAFTYQGRLTENNAPANGLYTLRFRLVQTSNGQPQGPVLTNSAVVVSNGLFTTTLDFGGYFGSREFALEIGVLTNGASPGFMVLAPSAVIRPSPLAISANRAIIADSVLQVPDGALSANIPRLDGPVTFTEAVTFSGVAQLPYALGNFNGAFIGDGAGVTNLNLGVNSAGAIDLSGFFLASSPSIAGSATSIAAADVNGDGKVDLIAVNLYALGNSLSVLTNDGSGHFALASSPISGGEPFAVTAADVNGDGKPDLICANSVNDSVSILTNNGSGGFSLSSTFFVGDNPAWVVAADLNGDGKVDFVTANYFDDNLSIMLNNGSGTFSVTTSPYVGEGPSSVAAVDVNGDGKIDLVSANFIGGTLTVLTNNGTGTFRVASSPAAGDTPRSMVAADVNGDGKVDLIAANRDADTLSVLINDGTGGFTLSTSPSVGSTPVALAAADMNGDGKVDLISANFSGDSLTVLTNNGSGGFVLSASPNGGYRPISVLALDVNGDGKADLINGSYLPEAVSVRFNTFNTPAFGGSFFGNGAGLTGLNAASLSSGTLADARLSANIARLNVNQTFSARNTFSGLLVSSTPGGFAQPQFRLEQTNPGDFARLRLGVAGSPQWDIAISPGATPELRFWNGSADKMILSYDGNLSFGTQTRQMLNLWGTQYGIGVQSGTLYFRTDERSGVAGGFAWYKGGTHDDRLQNAGGGATLMTLTSTGLVVNGTVLSSSDRNAKAGFEQVDAEATLEKVAALPITRWHYTNDAATAHVGPTAQDFRASFGLGSDDKHIATVDADGVALAAIQGLNRKLEEALKVKDAELKALQERFSRLEAAFERSIRKTE